MPLGSDEVDKIAHLARLQIDKGQMDEYVSSLSDILALVDQMNDIDTSGVEPMAHPQHAIQRLREDVVTEIDRREVFQRHAPAVENGLYLVPRVVE